MAIFEASKCLQKVVFVKPQTWPRLNPIAKARVLRKEQGAFGFRKIFFWKRGLFRKVHFLENLENLEILEKHQTVDLEILENLEILEILEVLEMKRPLS